MILVLTDKFLLDRSFAQDSHFILSLLVPKRTLEITNN